MKLTVLKTNVVVAALAHNPTILHPAFLESQNIVTGLELAEPLICTPAFSTTKFKNGLALGVTGKRLDVTDERVGADFSASEAPSITVKYIKALPHVRYTAVGVNFTAFVECPTPGKFLIDRFLKPGEWNSGTLQAKDLGLNFSYDVAEAVFSFACTAATVNAPTLGEKQGIVIESGYHTSLSEEVPLVEGAEAAICRYPERYEHFVNAAKCIVGLES